MTEPDCGSDVQSIKTQAEQKGNHYLINGSKTFITNGGSADLIILTTKTDPAKGAKGVSLILVDTNDLQGFRRGPRMNKLGQRGNDTAELFFDNVMVPRTNLLGEEEGQGFYQLMNQLPWERLLIGITALGTIDLALELLRTFVNDCIQRIENNELDAATASMAKYWGSETQNQIINECLQLHGGYGYMLDYPIARLYADSRVQMIYGGSNEIMKELIARSIDN